MQLRWRIADPERRSRYQWRIPEVPEQQHLTIADHHHMGVPGRQELRQWRIPGHHKVGRLLVDRGHRVNHRKGGSRAITMIEGSQITQTLELTAT